MVKVWSFFIPVDTIYLTGIIIIESEFEQIYTVNTTYLRIRCVFSFSKKDAYRCETVSAIVGSNVYLAND